LRRKNITGRKESDEVLYRDVDDSLGEDEAAKSSRAYKFRPARYLTSREAKQDVSGLDALDNYLKRLSIGL